MHNLIKEPYFLPREECPVCGSGRYTILYSCPFTSAPIRGAIEAHYQRQGHINWEYLDGTEYVICDCNDCGLIYQKYIPNEFMLDQIYNVMITPAFLQKLERSRLTVDDFEEIAGELAVIFRIIAKHPTEIRVLDYGCGYGRWSRVAVAMGAKVFATEISSEKISFAKTIGVEIIDDAIMSNMQFELIHTEQVFEHLTHPQQEFKKLARVLTPDGLIKVSVPRQGNIRNLIKKYGMIDWSPKPWNQDIGKNDISHYKDYNCIFPLEHLNAYSQKAMRTLAEKNNMKLVSQVRRRAIPLYTLNIFLMLQSLVKLLTLILRSIFRPESGYYIFALKKRSLDDN